VRATYRRTLTRSQASRKQTVGNNRQLHFTLESSQRLPKSETACIAKMHMGAAVFWVLFSQVHDYHGPKFKRFTLKSLHVDAQCEYEVRE